MNRPPYKSRPLYQGNQLNTSPAFSREDILIVLGLTLIAALLRIPGLDYGLWLDEVTTLIRHVTQPASQIVSTSTGLNNHVLYSLSAHFTTSWLGTSAWTLRLPAVVFGVLTVPALYYFGRQIGSRREALLATLFLVGSYHHVWFSQNARGYSGAALGSVLASILFIYLISTSRPRFRLISGYALVVALAAWMNLTGMLIGVAHGLIWLVLALDPLMKGRIRDVLPTAAGLVMSAALVLLLYAPLLQWFSSRLLPGISIDNALAPARLEQNSLLWTGELFLNGILTTLPGGLVVAGVVLATFAAGIFDSIRRGFVVGGLLLLPILVSTVTALVAMGVFFPRFIFASVPFIVLVGVIGGFKLAGTVFPFLPQRAVFLVGILVALLAGTQVPAAWEPKQDFEAASSFLKENQAAGSVFVCLAGTYSPMAVYHELDCLGVEDYADLEAIKAQHARTWVFDTIPTSRGGLGSDDYQRFKEDYQVVKVFRGTLGGGDIVLRSNKPWTASSPDSR